MISPCSSSENNASPSASLTPATSVNSPPDYDRPEFLINLENYLPLGCLAFEDIPQSNGDGDSEIRWQDVTDISLLVPFGATLGTDISKLAAAAWIRVESMSSVLDRGFVVYRIYILPSDVGRKHIDRENKRLWSALERLVQLVDVNPAAWAGHYSAVAEQRFDIWATASEGSLFYMFNKLPSPAPRKQNFNPIKDKYVREAMEDILEGEWFTSLKTTLYPYQRRSAGFMLQRESQVNLQLDPRLEPRTAPDGSHFYYSARDLQFFRHPRYYEACRGGILAETMGLGKTVICLALILATRHHLSKVPAPYDIAPRRPKTASLFDTALSLVNRKSIPWQVEFERQEHYGKDDTLGVKARLQGALPYYEIPNAPARLNRHTVVLPPERVEMAPTTIIIVPRNLCKQWQSEIKKHVADNALRILVMEDPRKHLPSAEELRTYDIVLFSRNRFEMEGRDGADDEGRRIPVSRAPRNCNCPYKGATRVRDCHCLKTDNLYSSPLKHLHFKRVIIDEGHFFTAKSANAVILANRFVTADHRWVVSGTPAKDLLGVEVDMSSSENLWQTPETKRSREAVLERRRTFSIQDDTSGAVKSLGSLASSFLKIRPWFTDGADERPARWEEHIYRHEDLRRRTYSGFSSSLQRTLGAMVVKTRPEDVERDIELPPLEHKVTCLEPSFYDKLTANLFTLVLTANAVTSERTDADYLFHKNSQKARYSLVANLRQSAFLWTGFSEADVLATLKTCRAYLEKENTACTQKDRELLNEALQSAELILQSKGWKFLSQSHELGLFVQDWPEESAELWSCYDTAQPVLTGVSQLLEAQRFVNERAGTEDPGEGLAGAGIKSLAAARRADGDSSFPAKNAKSVLAKSGIPTSSLDGEPSLKRRKVFSTKPVKGAKAAKSPKEESSSTQTDIGSTTEGASATTGEASTTTEGATDFTTRANADLRESVASQTELDFRPSKRKFSEIDIEELPAHSPFAQARIVGSTSSKLSYLASQILKYHGEEKILVFYDGDNVAYYIAQMLEALHIKHEIYAKSLAAALKSEYVVRFDQEAADRVLLMDVKQAAFGLNLSSASRIYFVNPVCRPNIEAQAIKRAHRIGQTRQVCVETLVLRGSIEEKMLERARRMTRSEHLDAKALEDDGGIREIIQSARVLPVDEEECVGAGQMARLEVPQRLWGREGWGEALASHRSTAGEKKKKKNTIRSDGQWRRQESSEEEKTYTIEQPGVCADLGRASNCCQ